MIAISLEFARTFSEPMARSLGYGSVAALACVETVFPTFPSELV